LTVEVFPAQPANAAAATTRMNFDFMAVPLTSWQAARNSVCRTSIGA
jgi:hypothetical protein